MQGQDSTHPICLEQLDHQYIDCFHLKTIISPGSQRFAGAAGCPFCVRVRSKRPSNGRRSGGLIA
ncbi:hypothetical protein BVI434_850103 [Burkholderia vietnamiensis]|nr:hypothetical protein BVI434_850103 [Burkholderia vietnamiensis]